jgi:tetratricopeptide (TPR) repeat protein
LDYAGIHEQICHLLIPLRTQLPFLPSEEERKKRDEDMKDKKLQLIEFTRSIAQRYLFESDYQRAIPGAMTSLKLVIDMQGLKSVDLVPSYLILSEASQGIGSYQQAQEYLSQAEWTVLKNPTCPVSIRAQLYRNMALLNLAQGDFDKSLRNLANDVYYSTEKYGPNSIYVSGGYFLMANIFFKMNKMKIADSLYRQVGSMWLTYLEDVVNKRTEISELDTILGKKDENNEKNNREEIMG